MILVLNTYGRKEVYASLKPNVDLVDFSSIFLKHNQKIWFEILSISPSRKESNWISSECRSQKIYSEINLAHIKLWRIFFPNIFTKSPVLTCFFVQYLIFFLHLSKVKLASQSVTSLSPEELAVSILFHLSLEPVA